MIAATPPQVSGAAGGHTISYQHLASRGATLLGRARGLDGRRLELAPDLGSNVRFADEVSESFRAAWDEFGPASGEGGLGGRPDPAGRPASVRASGGYRRVRSTWPYALGCRVFRSSAHRG
jgi:hypothetical protein